MFSRVVNPKFLIIISKLVSHPMEEGLGETTTCDHFLHCKPSSAASRSRRNWAAPSRTRDRIFTEHRIFIEHRITHNDLHKRQRMLTNELQVIGDSAGRHERRWYASRQVTIVQQSLDFRQVQSPTSTLMAGTVIHVVLRTRGVTPRRALQVAMLCPLVLQCCQRLAVSLLARIPRPVAD